MAPFAPQMKSDSISELGANCAKDHYMEGKGIKKKKRHLWCCFCTAGSVAVTEVKSSTGCSLAGLRQSPAGLPTTQKCLEEDVIVDDDMR